MTTQRQLTALAALGDGRLAGSWSLDPARSQVRLATKSMWGLVPVKGVFAQVSGSGTVPVGLKAVRERLTAEIDERQSSLNLLDEVMAAAGGDASIRQPLTRRTWSPPASSSTRPAG